MVGIFVTSEFLGSLRLNLPFREVFPVSNREALLHKFWIFAFLDGDGLVVILPQLNKVVGRVHRRDLPYIWDGHLDGILSVVVDSKASLGIVNDPPFVSKSSLEMPNQQFEHVIFRLNFREIGTIGHLAEAHHTKHSSDFAPYRTCGHENRKHLVGGGILRVGRVNSAEHFTEISEDFHLDFVFFGAECGIKCR